MADDPEKSEEFLLMENEFFIIRALAVRAQTSASMGILFGVDLTLFACFLIFFLVTEDNAWYNWLEFIQLFMWLGYIMLAAQSSNVVRNLKYLLVVSVLVFVVDLILAAFVRPIGFDNVNPLNECKRNDKVILIVLQAIFAGLDFIALCLAIYFQYASDLGNPSVLLRYETIDVSRGQYMALSIKYFLSNEKAQAFASEAAQIVRSAQDEELRLKILATAAAKGKIAQPPPPPPPPSTASPPPHTPTPTETSFSPTNPAGMQFPRSSAYASRTIMHHVNAGKSLPK